MGRVVITGPHKDPPSMAIYIILGTLKVTISFYQVLHSPPPPPLKFYIS